MTRVLFPPAAGVFSAVGLLLAEIELSESQAFLVGTDTLDAGAARAILERLEIQLLTLLAYRREAVRFRYIADMRFRGQAYELPIAFTTVELDRNLGTTLHDRFVIEHERTYGFAATGELGVQLVSLRVVVTVQRDTASPLRLVTRTHATTSPHDLAVHFSAEGAAVATPVIDRGDLDALWRVGPFVVEKYEGTLVVPPGSRASLDEFGTIVIEVLPS